MHFVMAQCDRTHLSDLSHSWFLCSLEVITVIIELINALLFGIICVFACL